MSTEGVPSGRAVDDTASGYLLDPRTVRPVPGAFATIGHALPIDPAGEPPRSLLGGPNAQESSLHSMHMEAEQQQRVRIAELEAHVHRLQEQVANQAAMLRPHLEAEMKAAFDKRFPSPAPAQSNPATHAKPFPARALR